MNKTYKDIIQNGDVIKYDISQHDKHFNSLIDNKIRYIENEPSLPMTPFEHDLMKDTFLFVGSENGTVRGHEYVDMGLPSHMKWATCNVGASSPAEFGTPYAWGEVFDKNIFMPNTSVFYNFPRTNLSMQTTPIGFSGRYLMDVAMEKWQIEYYDNNSIGCNPINEVNSLYKVADVFDGNVFENPLMNIHLYGTLTWRTPTFNDFKELLTNCTISRTPDGLIRLTSNINNNTLFFPPTTPVFENLNADLQNSQYVGCYYTSHESDEKSTSMFGITQLYDYDGNYTSPIEKCGIGVALQVLDDPGLMYVFLDVPKYCGMYIRPVIQI